MTTKPLRSEPQKRLYSLDALRGFDMFWITGGGTLAVILSKLTGAGWLEEQMGHASWEGFHFEDLIFPLFMFVSGVAIPYALLSKLEKNVPKKALVKKVFKRLLLLAGFGIIYNGALKNGFANARYASVLGQIGVGYFFASLIVIYFRSFRSQLIWLASILAGYALIQLVIPVPGFGAGVLTPEGCINGYIDRMFLPGRLHGGVYDPEGLMCCISATGITLMGTFAGNILRGGKYTDWQKIGRLAAIGAGLLVLALVISPFYPVIKKCWTSTFNILTGGISFLLIAFFYLVIDHWGFRKWAYYFRIIGMNSIFVYLFYHIAQPSAYSEYFFGWIAKPMGDSGALAIAVGTLVLIWLLLYYMYKKNIFLRV